MSRTWNRTRQRPRRAKRSSLSSDSRRAAPSSLAVAGQHLLTGIADLAAVGLQAAEDAEHVVLAIVMDELFAIVHHVRMAGGAFLIGALLDGILHRRRLRRQLRKCCRPGDKQNSDRHNRYA